MLERYSPEWSHEKISNYLGRIDTQIKRLNQMLDDAMLAIRTDSGYLKFHPEPLDLESFCQTIVQQLQETIGPGHQIQVVVTGSADHFQGDAVLLNHILANLLENAIKYSPDGGHIHLELCPIGSEMCIMVRDEGIGIPEADQARLFEAYYRANNVGQVRGSGLGLKIVKDCVEFHGGHIDVASAPGQGSQFSIYLPMNQTG